MTAVLKRNGREIWLDGPHYFDTLAALHERLKPSTYFEIGALHGQTLQLARCGSVAVDPSFQLTCDVEVGKPFCRLFEQTSDDFFAEHDLTEVLGAPVDLAFLDGMHQFAFLLRDFINTERHCRPGGAIVLHDCLPRDLFMTGDGSARSSEDGARRYKDYWTGDVWKLVPILKALRPDLKITCLDAAPTGLVICTGLDPQSHVLAAAYGEMVAQWSRVDLKSYGLGRLLAEAQVQSAETWLNAMASFHHPQPMWKRTLKRILQRP
jgi:hypothetical protein